MHLIERLHRQRLIQTPVWLLDNTMFIGETGSAAYGVSGDTSDSDVVGFCIPPKQMVFPHLSGEIMGFGRQIQRFEQFQSHRVVDQEARKTYDITIYSIVKFCQLAMENNPNMVDALFTPRRCVLHSTPVYERLREHRKLFLHKGCWHKFRGYAASQMSKIRNKSNASNPKRAETVEKFGYDTKFAYHLVRLILECEQILSTGDLALDRDREVLKSIRRGEWTLERLMAWQEEKERALETLYSESKLPHSPPEDQIKEVLVGCLEMHYGNLDQVIQKNPAITALLAEMNALIQRYSDKTNAGS